MTSYLIAALVLLATAAVVGWLRWRLRIVTVFGDSMRPALAPGDRLLVRRTPLSRVRAGDIVVIQHPWQLEAIVAPDTSARWLIKRAIATPGDPVPASVAPTLSVRPGSPVRDGALIAIGDNRDASSDSRDFGYVTASDLFGVVLRPIHRQSSNT
jgi:signal peptidase I